MFSQYGIFNYHEKNNTLLVKFSCEEITDTKVVGDITVSYHNNSIVSYSFKNFIRLAKIKYSGIIFLPADILIDVINDELKNHKLETLSYKRESGYVVKTVDGNRIVYALPGTFIKNETISNGHICTYDDLFIDNENQESIFIIDEEIKDDTDFFLMED